MPEPPEPTWGRFAELWRWDVPAPLAVYGEVLFRPAAVQNIPYPRVAPPSPGSAAPPGRPRRAARARARPAVVGDRGRHHRRADAPGARRPVTGAVPGQRHVRPDL
ncbi:hypothetical protein NKH77_50115 [Streptomyces sp. M19]